LIQYHVAYLINLVKAHFHFLMHLVDLTATD